MCTVYDVNNRDASGAAKIVRELAGYEGFLSSCRFLDDSHIVTGSGDMKIMVWDLETGKKTTEMDGHCGDVVSKCANSSSLWNELIFRYACFRFQFLYRQTKILLSLVQLIKRLSCGTFVRPNQSKRSSDIRLMSIVSL